MYIYISCCFNLAPHIWIINCCNAASQGAPWPTCLLTSFGHQVMAGMFLNKQKLRNGSETLLFGLRLWPLWIVLRCLSKNVGGTFRLPWMMHGVRNVSSIMRRACQDQTACANTGQPTCPLAKYCCKAAGYMRWRQTEACCGHLLLMCLLQTVLMIQMQRRGIRLMITLPSHSTCMGGLTGCHSR